MPTEPINLSTSGHDAAVVARELDDYDRWPIAVGISKVIESSPPEWSTRIGLYGRWGDGKTTVLNFLEHIQSKHGNIVIRYSPWGISNDSLVLADFGKCLRSELKRNGIALGWWSTICFWFKSLKGKEELVLKGAAFAAEKGFQIPVPKAAVSATAGLIERYLKFSAKDIERISSSVGKRRVVVFIDDLDRSDPAVVPKLLLALRELLDLSKFVFVVAFDRFVIARALSQYNTAWGNEGEIFLEKIIDFPFSLPAPMPTQVGALAHRQFGQWCSFVPKADVEATLKFFPTNPRKVKLFARLVYSLKSEAVRHDADELDWSTILILTLIRMESEEFARELVNRLCDENEFSWGAWAFESEKKAEQDEQVDEVLQTIPDLSESNKARLRSLVDSLRAQRKLQVGERLKYQFYFAVRPHNITRGEFMDYFAEWRKEKKHEVTNTFIGERSVAMDVDGDRVAVELIESVVNYYGTLLENASGAKDTTQHATLIAEASACLDLFQEIFTSEQGEHAGLNSASIWHRLVRVALDWQHFVANVGEPELRSKEMETLIACAQSTSSPVEFFEALRPWRKTDVVFDERSARLKNEFVAKIGATIEPKIVESAIALFKTPGALRRLRSRDAAQGYLYLFTSPNSPVFSDDRRVQLMDAIHSSGTDSVVSQNAQDFLRLLMKSLDNQDSPFCNPDQRKEFIAANGALIAELWRVTISKPLQFRFLSGAREQREKLVEAGAIPESLVTPEWLLENTQ